MECGDENQKKERLLKLATENLLLGNNFKAILLYKDLKKKYYDEFSILDICIVEYSLAVAYTRSPRHVNKCLEILLPFVVEHGETFPPLYYRLAMLLFQQHCYPIASSVIKNGLDFISKLTDSSTFESNWPGTDVQIPESNTLLLESMLKSLQKDCDTRIQADTTGKCASDDGFYLSDSSNNECDDTMVETNICIMQKSVLKPDCPEFVPKMNFVYSDKKFIAETSGSSGTLHIDKCNQIIPDLSSVATQTPSTMNDESTNETDSREMEKLNFLNGQITEILHLQEKNKTDANESQEHICNNLKLILSTLTENNQLQEKIKILEEEARVQQDLILKLNNDYKGLLEKQLNDRTQTKLEVQLEEREKTVCKLENKIQQHEIAIKYLESFSIEQLNLYYSSQKQYLSRTINRCIQMNSDLHMAKEYLSSTSCPTLAQCSASISDWKALHNLNVEHLQLIECYYQSYLNRLRNNDYQLLHDRPPLLVDIEPKNILHDNYIPTVIYFVRPQNYGHPPSHSTRYYTVQGPQFMVNQNYVNERTRQSSLPPHPLPGRPLKGMKKLVPASLEYGGTSESSVNIVDSNCRIFQNSSSSSSTQKECDTDSNVSDEPIAQLSEKDELQINDEVKKSTDEIVDSAPSSLETHEMGTIGETQMEEKDSVVDDQKTLQTENDDASSNTKHAPPSSSPIMDEASGLTKSNVQIQNEDIQVPDAVRAFGGPKFCKLFIHIRKQIENVSDDDLFCALKRVKARKVKLSGLAKEIIMASVKHELQNGSRYSSSDGNLESPQCSPSDNACPICFDEYDQLSKAVLKCQHSFHVDCIKKWFTTNSICPICRLHATTEEGFHH